MSNQGQKSGDTDMGENQGKKADGSQDQRHQDHGQGQVKKPDTDMRLKDNRDNPEKAKEHADATKG